jgi:hypothetical protein
MDVKKILFAVSILLLTLMAIPATPQSLTSGDITGLVTDPSGAIVPNAKVTLKNNQTGAANATTTNAQGTYRFSLLNPGSYTVTASAPGFQPSEHAAEVAVGQAITANIQMALAGANTTVEVSAGGNVIQTENADVTTNLTPTQIASIPNPGNDLSYYVQTAPGATMNTQAGYGNSAMFGISGTSNLYTINGMNDNDPFFNVNNSGATNLLLGANDVSTAAIVNNGYSGQYGELAGANVNFVTKSGTNNFHGNAEYFWDGSVMNANDWFNDHTSPVTPRPFVNANQWAASFGGPIKKDKTFFFVDNEGLRLLIPTVSPVNVPSPQFEAATLGNLATNGNAAEIPFYNQIFSLYNNARGGGYSRAANILPAGGCDGGVALAGGAPCALQFQSSINNLTTEWLLSARVDQNIGNNDRAFIHFRTDHGEQASFTDPLNAAFNAQSNQPQYEGQFQENHTVSPNAINQFIMAGSWYSAVFAPPSLSAATALMPYDLTFAGGELATPGGIDYSTWPQGRHDTQYQFEDDYAWQKGNHSLKFGADFRRNDITDYAPGGFGATIPTAIFANLGNFYAGTVSSYTQSFATSPTEPINFYSLGLYAQDEWAVKANFKLTLSLRAQRDSNLTCVTNCFSRLTSTFGSISHDPLQPYNQAIASGLGQALPNFQGVSWEPRVGFAYQPFGNGSGTVFRGGIGIFSDMLPGLLASSFDSNSPLRNTFLVSGLQLAPGLPGSAQTAATTANSAFVSGFNSGLNIAQIEAGPNGTLFSPPAMVNPNNNLRYPTYQEWNFEVEQAIGSKMSVTLNYVGNHGSDLAMLNPGVNAFCNTPGTPLPYEPGLAGAGACTSELGIAGFTGLPTSPVDPRFSTVSEVTNEGVSNYNGLTASFTVHASKSLQVNANYTWSHALDDISNAGFLPANFDTNISVLAPQDPYNFKAYNYGNADYDARNQFNLNYVYNTPVQHGWMGALLNWTVAGTIFARSGLPFTIFDGASSGVLGSYFYGPAAGLELFGNSLVGPLTCGSSATITPCPTSSQFASPIVPGAVSTFGDERRNQVYGPNFFDTDLGLMKNFSIPHWEGAQFQIGAQAYNLFNHPNFDQPVGDLSNPQFGSILRTVGSPTSIFGSFLGGDASPRAVQIRAQLQF